MASEAETEVETVVVDDGQEDLEEILDAGLFDDDEGHYLIAPGDYEEVELEEKTPLWPQFDVIRDLAVDVTGLVADKYPERAEAGRLVTLVAELQDGMHTEDYQHGVALSEMFAILMSLFRLGRRIEDSFAVYCSDPESPLVAFDLLMPQLRSCVKLVSDEIALFALPLVQTEVGVQQLILEDISAADETPEEQIARDQAVAMRWHRMTQAQARADYTAYLTGAVRVEDAGSEEEQWADLDDEPRDDAAGNIRDGLYEDLEELKKV